MAENTPTDWLAEMNDEMERLDPSYAPYANMFRLERAVREARKSAGLTQRDLADRMGVKQPQVARFEKDPSVATLKTALAYFDAIGVEVDFVVRPRKAVRRGRKVSTGPKAAKKNARGLKTVKA